jgi:uncharacterized membrane protein YesL
VLGQLKDLYSLMMMMMMIIIIIVIIVITIIVCLCVRFEVRTAELLNVATCLSVHSNRGLKNFMPLKGNYLPVNTT